MAATTGADLSDLTLNLEPPSRATVAGSADTKEQARAYIERAILLVGEADFAALVESAGQERLRTAVSRLMGSDWWQQTIKMAMVQPMQFNTQLLCKLLDKAVPTQQAAKQGVEEGFKLVIETVPVAA